MTKDSFKGRANDSESLNRYAYAQGDPVNLVDPTGHDVDAPGMDLGTGLPYNYGDEDYYEVDMSLVRSTTEGIADGAITHGIINKLKDTKEVSRKAPSFGPGFQVKQFKVSNGVKLLKGVSKFAGPVAIGSWGYDMYQDYNNYRDSLLIAMGLTSGAAALGILAGVIAGTTFGLPVVLATGISIGVGAIANVGATAWKRKLLK